jgi:hypothetical protein
MMVVAKAAWLSAIENLADGTLGVRLLPQIMLALVPGLQEQLAQVLKLI